MLLNYRGINVYNCIRYNKSIRSLSTVPYALYQNSPSVFKRPVQSKDVRNGALRHASNIGRTGLSKHVKGSPIPLIRKAIFKTDTSSISSPIRFVKGPIDFSTLFSYGHHSSPNTDRIIDVRNVVMQNLFTHEDGLRFVAAFPAFIGALGSDTKNLSECEFRLRTYNAIIYRLRQRDIPFNDVMISQGLVFASMAKSVVSMCYYLKLLTPGYKLDRSKSLKLLRNLMDLVERAASSLKDHGTRKKELLDILIGSPNATACEVVREWQSCLYSIMDKTSSEVWGLYISMVQKLANPETVHGEWLRFKASRPIDTGSERTGVEGEMQAVLTSRISELFIQRLVTEDPELAWQIAEEVEYSPKVFQHRTWDVLLEHSEFMRKWRPEMSNIILRRYEEKIHAIEKALGVKWSGGEDGYHVSLNRTKHGQLMYKTGTRTTVNAYQKGK